MKRTLLALCTLALAAAPVLAGPVYLPGAIHVTVSNLGRELLDPQR